MIAKLLKEAEEEATQKARLSNAMLGFETKQPDA